MRISGEEKETRKAEERRRLLKEEKTKAMVPRQV